MQKVILATLIYADLFDFPLTKKEIWSRLIWSTDKKAKKLDFDKTLASLIVKKRISKKSHFFFLPGREEIVGLRKKRNRQAVIKLEKANRVAVLIKLIPSVKLVAVTGSVASGNAKKDDDIDLFVIASSGMVWTTRFLVTVLITLFGVRRFPGQINVKDKICLNLFLAENHLDAFAKKGDLFLANEVVQLKLFWQRGNVYQQFLLANSWVRNFLPNAITNTPATIPVKAVGVSGATAKVEEFFYRLQLWWMKKRKTREVTKPHLIAFHPQDGRNKTLKKFRQATKRLR